MITNPSIDETTGKVRLSPSQIATHRDCPRKRAFSRVLPGRPNRFAELGTRVHSVLEAWLQGGTLLDTRTEEGLIASSGIEHLPRPGVCAVESSFRLETDVAIYTGRRDMRWSEPLETLKALARTAALGPVSRALHIIGDHKTTTDLGWAKKPEDLKTDPQGVIYAASVYAEPDVRPTDAVENRWVYYTTRAPYKSRRVSLVVTYDETVERMKGIDATAAEIRDMDRAFASPHDFPPEASACEAYGGCPYQTECKITKEERFKAAMTQSAKQEALRAKLAARGNGTPAPAPAPAPAPTPAAPAAPALSPRERLAAARAAQAPAPAAPAREEALEAQAKEKAASIDTASRREPPAKIPVQDIEDQHRVAGLRDQLAMSALNGMLARGTDSTPHGIAVDAYAIADAMLEARKA